MTTFVVLVNAREIKAGLTSFSFDTSKRSDILLFNKENHRDSHCIVSIVSEFL